VLHTEQRGEFLLKGGALWPEREPEVECRTDGRLHLIRADDARRIGHGRLSGSDGLGVVRTGTIGAVGQRREFSGQAKDLRLQLCRGSGHRVQVRLSARAAAS
jgi:hypothetical protein